MAGPRPLDPYQDAPLPFERNAPYAPTPDNRPAPLESGPLPLACDARPQMSFGERAALEGILAQVRPALALEIGTAEGGSLDRIAAYSAEVHSIDLDHERVHSNLPPHVALHTGSSAELLPPLLESFADDGRSLDFALVDGDHSFEGVRGDLEGLLRSPVSRRAVILVHDTMNAEIRAGIESVGLDDYEEVVYYEFDFVPGYIYSEGVCRDAVWGGLGLIITGAQRSPAYASSPRQSRYVEPFPLIHRMRAAMLADRDQGQGVSDRERLAELEAEVTRAHTELAVAGEDLAHQAQALDDVRHSKSWRLTKPARTIMQRVRAGRT